ncbi:MAG: 2'-deoxycytidine 5'-triphosphate deaminase [Candidatus Nanoarchaeia archaeon]|nr:2'-deoxycytidine 5'-triphosphate deaminase [Candidatus Nanoarchaeia archaeon]
MSGVLPYQEIKALMELGNIYSATDIEEFRIQPASLDLTISNICYRLKTSFIPRDNRISDALKQRNTHTFTFNQEGLVLEKGVVYLFPLNEKIKLPKGISSRSNPKSTTGRDDLFTRLISDYSDKYDTLKGSNLYLEVNPLSFPHLIKPGESLNQIRFYSGSSRLSDVEIRKLHQETPLVYGHNGKPLEDLILGDGVYLTANFSLPNVGWKAVKNPGGVVDMSKIRGNKAEDFWEKIKKPKDGRVILNPGDFFILGTKEYLNIPKGYCAEVVPFEAELGELRTHYAGFIDPGFEGDLTLEVRAQDVPFEIEDGQIICRIVLDKLVEESEKPYDEKIGSNYKKKKGPQLSKLFK